MANPYPIEIQDESGVERLVGEATFTDPGNQPGGIYVPPTAREILSGNDVTINNNANAPLTWDSHNSGTALLDRTAPAAPTIITAGIYAVSVNIALDAPMTAGGSYRCTLALDAAGDNAIMTSDAPAAVTAQLGPQVVLSETYYIPAGGTVVVTVANLDGVQNLPFFIQEAVVQRIT